MNDLFESINSNIKQLNKVAKSYVQEIKKYEKLNVGYNMNLSKHLMALKKEYTIILDKISKLEVEKVKILEKSDNVVNNTLNINGIDQDNKPNINVVFYKNNKESE